MKQRSHATLPALIVVLAGCSFPGQRLLHVRLEQDGQLVAEGIYSVPDTFDRQATWERLVEASLETIGELTPDANDANVATLTGKIHVKLEHASRPYASADATRLRLVADPANAGQWKIDAAEVTRLVKTLK